MKHITDALVIVLLVSSGFAQSPLQLGTDQEPRVNELEHSWKELRAKDPAAWNKFKASLLLDAQKALAEFGYGTVFTAALDDKTQEALRTYQRRNGLPVTGDMDGRTWVRLQEDKSALGQDIPLGPLYMFSDSDWNNFVKVEGAWLEQGKEPDAATPLKTAVVECMKPANICVAANSDGTGYIQLEWFAIERWDKYEITTQPNDLPCGRETIRITKPDRTLLAINTAAYKNVEACTNLFGKPSEQMVSRLGDERKIIDARLRAFRSASDRILLVSPEAKHLAGLEDH
jgi:hypothetical protein